MGDYRQVDCDVAREALSARLDGEAEPVPSARVDEHLRTCAQCRSWYAAAEEQSRLLRTLAGVGPGRTAPGLPAPATPGSQWLRRYAVRAALAAAGIFQLGIAAAQAAGADFGMVSAHHGAAMGGVHLLNESTAWLAALGVTCLVAAARPRAVAGLACLGAVYTLVLAGYVVADAFAGQVTAARVLSHVPVVAATALAATLWWTRRAAPVPVRDDRDNTTIQTATVADLLDRRRRRDLPPSGDSAA